MQSNITQKPKRTFWLYLLIYYLIIGSDCIIFCFNKNESMVKYSQYFMVFLSLCFSFFYLIKKKFVFEIKDLILIFVLFFLLFSAFYHREFSGGYISVMALFVLGNSFFDIIDVKEFKKIFLNLMTVICIVSLLTFVFSSFFLKLSIFPSFTNTLGREYRFFFFSNISLIDPDRNYGLFTEPSRFQAYINLSLIFIMFDNDEKINIKRMILFIVTLITTFSTTGFMAFAVILIAFLFSNRIKINKVTKMFIIVVLLLGIVFLFMNNEDFFYSIHKITLGESSRSASTRFNSFFANLKIIFENHLFGTGITNADRAFSVALSELGGLFASSNTITILIYFAKFGLIPGLYYAFNMINAIRNIGNRNNTLFLVLGFIMMTCGISFIESIIFSIIIFYPNRNKGMPAEDKNKLRIQKS